MSPQPDFKYHFRCDFCDATSDEYSVYVFWSLFEPRLSLPAWSLTHKFWGQIYANLSSNQRSQMDSNRDELIAFAASLSNDNLTVGVPRFSAGKVEVTPDPLCPFCGRPCQCHFEYSPESKPGITAAQFLALPIVKLDCLSFRSRKICHRLGFHTLGDLEEGRALFESHPQVTEANVAEVDELLSRKPSNSRPIAPFLDGPE